VRAALLAIWAEQADALQTLGEALLDPVQRSWGCASCVVLGAGVSLGAGLCADGVLPACVGALTGGGTFIENCEGACTTA
jgi:hypothetical protein